MISYTCANPPDMPTWAVGEYTDADEIILRPELCRAIDRAEAGRISGLVQLEEAAIAVFTLGHELGHREGIADSDVTATGEDSGAADCYSWRHFGETSRGLGLPHGITLRMRFVVAPLGRNACKRSGR